MNVGVSGLVVAQHLWSRTAALQAPASNSTTRVLAPRTLEAGGRGAPRIVAAQTSPLVPSRLGSQPRRPVPRWAIYSW